MAGEALGTLDSDVQLEGRRLAVRRLVLDKPREGGNGQLVASGDYGIDTRAYSYDVRSTGLRLESATLADGLQKALDEALARLPIPKVMQYQLEDGWTNVHFVRPAHGLVALHGADLVPVATLGLTSGRETHGHRFESAIDPVVIQDADHYARQLLEQGAVIAGFIAGRILSRL